MIHIFFLVICHRKFHVFHKSNSRKTYMFDQRKAYFVTKCDEQLLQIATAFSLQSATRFIASCNRYYKVR